jgi:hypothetical protein
MKISQLIQNYLGGGEHGLLHTERLNQNNKFLSLSIPVSRPLMLEINLAILEAQHEIDTQCNNNEDSALLVNTKFSERIAASLFRTGLPNYTVSPKKTAIFLVSMIRLSNLTWCNN